MGKSGKIVHKEREGSACCCALGSLLFSEVRSRDFVTEEWVSFATGPLRLVFIWGRKSGKQHPWYFPGDRLSGLYRFLDFLVNLLRWAVSNDSTLA